MHFEYEPERLINEVSKRPGLWDMESQDYRARNVKAKLWNEIMTELMKANNDSVNMTKSEMRELELQLQKKWKSIRDCFQKYLANPTKFKRPYLYSNQLRFLLKGKDMPVQRKRMPIQAGSGSSESDEEEPKNRNRWVSKKKVRLPKAERDDGDGNDEVDDYPYDGNSFNESTSADARNEGSCYGQFAFANVDAQIKGETEDSDKMFLMSLLPHLRSIPEEFRLNVKLELMQVLRVANESTAKLKFNKSSLD